MSFFDAIFLNSIYVLFPMLIYIVFLDYKKIDYKEYALDIALFSSLFLMIRFNNKEYNDYSIILLNIPLFFSYIKCKRKMSISLSLLLVLYLLSKELNFQFSLLDS